MENKIICFACSTEILSDEDLIDIRLIRKINSKDAYIHTLSQIMAKNHYHVSCFEIEAGKDRVPTEKPGDEVLIETPYYSGVSGSFNPYP